MKIKSLFFIVFIFISSCQFVDKFKGNEAIKLVQSKKFGVLNAYNLKMGLFRKNPTEKTYGNLFNSSGDPTNLEMANFISEALNTDTPKWVAKYSSNQIFLVAFLFDNNKEKGTLIWEANIDNQIVRCVTCDPDLMKKYNLADSSSTTISHKRHKKKK